jgi:hypothetical protein
MRLAAAAWAVAGALAGGVAPSLVDRPIIGDAVQYLDGIWGVSNGKVGAGTGGWGGGVAATHTSYPTSLWQGIEVDGAVPGDLLTDLQRGGVIGDPFYELNFIPWGATEVPVWDAGNWTYTTTFDLIPQATGPSVAEVGDPRDEGSVVEGGGVAWSRCVAAACAGLPRVRRREDGGRRVPERRLGGHLLRPVPALLLPRAAAAAEDGQHADSRLHHLRRPPQRRGPLDGVHR